MEPKEGQDSVTWQLLPLLLGGHREMVSLKKEGTLEEWAGTSGESDGEINARAL